MVIGVVGASLSGLVAGDRLARAGHDVTVIEKDRTLGGRLATKKTSYGFFDYGLPYLKTEGDRFSRFLQKMKDEDLLQTWTNHFPLFEGGEMHDVDPSKDDANYLVSRDGLHVIPQHLKRWVDVKSDVKAGGLTYFGADREKKRAWMINLTDISVFECDAVILALPAPQAYGMLLTAQDETPVRRIIRIIDGMPYEPRYSLMASYDEPAPDWNGIECNGQNIRWISNESSKKEDVEKSNILIQSSGGFAHHHYHQNHDAEEISQAMLTEAANITEQWLVHPQESELHFWKYYRAINTIDEYFMELEMDDAPLALIGDYFNGNSVAAAYDSASYLADYWIDKYESKLVQV